MPRPKRSLHDLALHGTFRVERHQHLLASEELREQSPYGDERCTALWNELRDLQRAYRETPWPRVRRALAHEFADVVRQIHRG
jgi:hypothetical protein